MRIRIKNAAASAVLIFLSLVSLPLSMYGDELPASLRTQMKYTQHQRFTIFFSENDWVVLDKGKRVSEIVRNGKVTETVKELMDIRSAGTASSRRKHFSEQVVMSTLSNVVTNGKSIAAVHRLSSRSVNIRVVQVLDRDLKPQYVYEEVLPWSPQDYRLGVEPFALSEEGRYAGLGEQGEILVHERDGSLMKCVVVDGVFTDARQPALPTVDEKRNPHLSAETLEMVRSQEQRSATKEQKVLDGHDQACAGKRLRVPFFDYSNINGLFFLPDQTLNILIGSDNIRRIDLESGRMTTYTVSAQLKSDVSREDELIYQVICRGWDIFALTLHRIIHLRMDHDLEKVSQLAIKWQEDLVNQWNVLPDAHAGTGSFVYVDYTVSGKTTMKFWDNK